VSKSGAESLVDYSSVQPLHRQSPTDAAPLYHQVTGPTSRHWRTTPTMPQTSSSCSPIERVVRVTANAASSVMINHLSGFCVSFLATAQQSLADSFHSVHSPPGFRTMNDAVDDKA